MVLISFTNIIVDDFSYGKTHGLKKYIYFLTHMHSDHYQGITPTWNYGPIYCSKITKQLLLLKFPYLKNVREIPMNVPYKLCIHQENNIDILVYLFDSNHCPGSVMFLFEGYFGRILHTGDMRFNQDLLNSNPILFPISKNPPQNSECPIKIDECIFDNTFCDKIFNFCDKPSAKKIITDIISQHIQTNDTTNNENNLRVLLCIDSIGKEDLLVYLSQTFFSQIVVNEQKYQELVYMNDPENIPLSLFSTNREDGWIEVIRKNEKYSRLYSKQNQVQNNEYCIAITCSGWANIKDYITYDNRDYLVAYSSHSNYKELELFVQTIRPGILNTIVRKRKSCQKIEEIGGLQKYLFNLHDISQRGVEELRKNCSGFSGLSQDYKCLMNDLENQRKINQVLNLEETQEERVIEDTVSFQQKHQNMFKNKSRFNKGAKLNKPDENKLFNRDSIIEIQKNLEKVKDEIKGKNKEEIIKDQEEKVDERIEKEKIVKDDTKLVDNLEHTKDQDEEDDNEYNKRYCDYDELDADDEVEIMKRLQQIKEIYQKQAHSVQEEESQDKHECEKQEISKLNKIPQTLEDNNSHLNQQQEKFGFSRKVNIRVIASEPVVHKGEEKIITKKNQEKIFNNKENIDEENYFKDKRDNNNQHRLFEERNVLKERKEENQLIEKQNRIGLGQQDNQHKLLKKRKHENIEDDDDDDVDVDKDDSDKNEEQNKYYWNNMDRFISEKIKEYEDLEDQGDLSSNLSSQSNNNYQEDIQIENEISPGQKDNRSESSENLGELFDDIEDAKLENQEITENEDITSQSSQNINEQKEKKKYQQGNQINCENSWKDEGFSSNVEDIEESSREDNYQQHYEMQQDDLEENDDHKNFVGQHKKELSKGNINLFDFVDNSQSNSSISDQKEFNQFEQSSPQNSQNMQQYHQQCSNNQEIFSIPNKQNDSQNCDTQLDNLISENSFKNESPKIILNKQIPVFKSAAMNALFEKYLIRHTEK